MSRSLNYWSKIFALGLLLLNAACSTTSTSSATTVAAPSPVAAAAETPAQSAESQVPRISVEELKQLMAAKQVVVVDVRSIDAYNGGHIKGSISLPLDKIQAGEHKSLPHDKRIITYCSCGAENSSSAASVMLEKAGFKNGATLKGGTSAWQQAGGAMEQSASKPKA